MNEKPEALRLADWCDANSSGVYRPAAEAAAELRRLYAENEKLLSALEQPPVEQEPVAYLFQHEETGYTQYVDVQQVEWGFEKNNPRWQKIGPVYTHPQSERVQLTDDAEHQCPYPKANPSTRNAWLDGWEAAERAHGIGGEA